MANEHVLVVETHTPINFTSATAIEKGAVLKLTTPMTASLSNGAVDKIAGIAQSEVNSSAVSVAVYRGGIFRGKFSGSGSAGDALVTHGNANVLKVASVNDENIIGYALEDFTEGQNKLYELRPTTMNLA